MSTVREEQKVIPGFLLTRQWLEKDKGQDLIFWVATVNGPVKVVIEDQTSVFFVRQEDVTEVEALVRGIEGFSHATVQLKSFTEHEELVACYFHHQRALNFARSRLEQAGVAVFEGDLRPTDRYLMERFITGSVGIVGDVDVSGDVAVCLDPRLLPGDEHTPQLQILSLDIETSVSSDVILSIAVFNPTTRLVFMVSDEPVESDDFEVRHASSEKELLVSLMEWLSVFDPDVIIGWNVVAFDLDFMQKRCDSLGLELLLGRDGEAVRWRSARGSDRKYALVPGRVVLDGIEMLRTATYSFESFALENVARELLGKGKLVSDVDSRAQEIEEMYSQDKLALAAYNLQDCELVWDIFETTELIEFTIERSRLTGLDMDRPGGSVAAFDFLYLPRLHREGFVSPRAGAGDDGGSPGGFVLESRAGLFDHVAVLDFKSLYPSIIRTFNVDPLALTTADENAIDGFKGARFSRDRALLPKIIESLWAARDRAKRDGRNAMSQAIKIIMNSFYGVLGTPACRFFDARLASSITMRGHEILKQTQQLIEARGYPVIYGDTDSVFVHFGSRVEDVSESARELVDYLNRWFSEDLKNRFEVASYLEVEYETHFDRFLMPTVRGSEKGSKKRYAGLVREDAREFLVFKGLETVRSDWSPLAREFQQELYRRIFLDLPYSDYVKSMVSEVRGGERDDQLVLRRRMRRRMAEYVKNVPPHVRAARKQAEIRAERGLPPLDGSWIEYVMTSAGPEPRLYSESPIDYDFYVDRQLAPIADAILAFKSTSLAELTDRQMSLF